ncbi:HEAT repeat-containing protein 5A [Thalassophryne amazonica]|uniref:HEAT repeat-containing protein 5A n=1 Tax=Thalassophryne amazonica TaxID=390379 RepID=UPI0014720897|nr:HEAT repeat-containing protein 5A [Thalassophryne amazonica]
MSRQEKSRGAWKLLLRSALKTLLGLWESEELWLRCGSRQPPHCSDHPSCCAAGPDVCAVEPLHTLVLQRFSTSNDAKDPAVVIRCFQLLTSVFQTQSDVAIMYIKALGAQLVRFLQTPEVLSLVKV